MECIPSELTGEFLAVVFSPGELALIQEGPSERRVFLDGAISQVMPRYMTTLAAMSRILLQRNTLITDMQKSGNAAMMEPLLETWDRSLAKVAFSVCHARARFIRRLALPRRKFTWISASGPISPFPLPISPASPPRRAPIGPMFPRPRGKPISERLLAAARQ